MSEPMRETEERDPAAARLDRPVTLAVAGLVAATVLLGALLPGAPVPRPLAPQDDPACAEWTDGCRVCRRAADGPHCSTPGIACTRTVPECLGRS